MYVMLCNRYNCAELRVALHILNLDSKEGQQVSPVFTLDFIMILTIKCEEDDCCFLSLALFLHHL